MNNKLLSFILVGLLLVLAVIKPVKKVINNYKHLYITNNDINLDNIELENYVIGVVAAEMPASFSFEALKAQAVASRTFAYKKVMENSFKVRDLYNDEGQAYLSSNDLKEKWKDNYDYYLDIVKKAIKETRGEILTYNSYPINAYYYSMSNGSSEDSRYVFGEEPYLKVIEIPWDKENTNNLSTKELSVSEFKRLLEIDGDITIDKIDRLETGHVSSITISGKSIKGIDFRKKLDLKSTDFNIDIKGDLVTITCKGYGHGVGMSQYGANSLALEGKNYKEILSYFYKDVVIEKI